MASIAFPSHAKKAKLSDGTQYGYVYVPAEPGKPTLLLLHGFPSSSYDWRYQINHLPKSGYGVLVPDLLGYGDTDKPSDVESYTLKKIGVHLDELLTIEKLDKVIGVGHDFGSMLLTHLTIYWKSRLSAAAFVAVGFMDPSVRLDVAAVNAYTKEVTGESALGYIAYFMTDDAVATVNSAPKTIDSILYAADAKDFRHYLGAEGALETALKNGTIVKQDSGLGGYQGPLNWYRVLVNLTPSEDDKVLTEEQKEFSFPTLFVMTQKDHVIDPENQLQTTSRYARNIHVERLDTGHWAHLEKKDEFEKLFDQWLEKL
ncbi:Cytosolic epoxide hydrolase 2-like protein [Cladobotryum mycophilum]|uniref:Cytosolic epoxide hydrolase 2-like protein n=1 Tax=Cladobotryum mycophilum TaxID=491253 RepID=A0ABR0S8P8_9HYPO